MVVQLLAIADEMLDVLGEYFVSQNLVNKGWQFVEFVQEYQNGFIAIR